MILYFRPNGKRKRDIDYGCRKSGYNGAMRSFYILLMLPFLLLPAHTEAAPEFPPTGGTISLREKGPLPVDATVDGLPVTLRGGSVIVSAGNNNALKHVDLGQDALTPFTALLKAYPRARSFDLSWYEPVFLDADGADVLYDRKAHTVTVDYSYGGGIDPQITGRVRFTHVRESVFAALLRAHPKGGPKEDTVSDDLSYAHHNNAATWGGFQFLYQPRYGCPVLAPVRHRHRHLRHIAR